MIFENKVYMGKSGDEKILLLPSMANRHGLIAGATGTGKTVTLKVMAESFSKLGVPVFIADIKGDVAGMASAGIDNENMQKRIKNFELENFTYEKNSVSFWDIYGNLGLPVRTTISEMGPTLLARILNLNETQEGILYIIFRIADDNGWLLLDIKDLRAMLQYVSDNSSKYIIQYGNIQKQSIGAISRALLTLEDNGGSQFFGEPSLDINDWIAKDASGNGIVNILDATKLVNNPKLYSTFLLWMLTDLYERLPEVGDLDKPKILFFFDEAHLLFKNISSTLLEKVELVVKLIRSKGVGVYFITQNPADIPDSVLAQLGNKIQHALRAYTPTEMKAVKVAANSFRPNPNFSTEKIISEMGIGEALVSFLDEKGKPNIVKRTAILPPQCNMGVLDDYDRKEIIFRNPLGSKYVNMIDRESAYEILIKKYSDEDTRKEAIKEQKEREKAEKIAEKERLAEEKRAEKEAEKLRKEKEKEEARIAKEKAKYKSPFEKMATTAARTATNTVTRSIATKISRGIMDMLLGKKK
ncbi:helicase HerA-like domain-containing protein [Fusobacterium sp. PH5-44]|uniref:helicase HerA-like domain-containing protein n=1 Tax=unclassified Fusobacterium TaxID=2648384 RepID=UPI003D1D9CA0